MKQESGWDNNKAKNNHVFISLHPPAKGEQRGCMERIFNLAWSKDRRRSMRRLMTPEETMLWDFLKENKLSGEKFRRQHGIGSYIVDFYCARMKLVIEVDGDVHKDTIEYDAERDAYLTGAGCKVLRFSNKQVRDRVFDVIESIRSEIATSPF